ncbi:hypothetical protein FRACYDRAFT_231039 [Fragilariopsis cylindrus CCMP1102]|uniref:Uncharacterized protein n=1 Tax=Fragilariopsis cylindrus CCMP1102 TaxID=635003 RepID=A0A1E7EJS8_9STRA|nr:hypothetical protein FRACYDRAFT_231039 [Fragilariopsis cylindrus CCMP1102]|eukprot:OEU06150.1 hypothetical protein FRACYDRAFT_231039 [Fragilariopsis cylindrus CCMP1102]
MFVSFARQYRRVLFSRIPKPRHLTTLYSPPTGTSVPRHEGCEVYSGMWQWPLGKVIFNNHDIDDNVTLSVRLDEGEVEVDMWLVFCDSEDDCFETLRLKVELNDTNAEKRLSEFFQRVRLLKKINGMEYFDMTTDVQYQYPCKLSTSAHTKLVSLELEIQQLIQNWDLRQLALEVVSLNYTSFDARMCGLHGATELGVIGGMWDTDTRRDEIMERYGIDEEGTRMFYDKF